MTVKLAPNEPNSLKTFRFERCFRWWIRLGEGGKRGQSCEGGVAIGLLASITIGNVTLLAVWGSALSGEFGFGRTQANKTNKETKNTRIRFYRVTFIDGAMTDDAHCSIEKAFPRRRRTGLTGSCSGQTRNWTFFFLFLLSPVCLFPIFWPTCMGWSF